ncbi:MAG: orotate phosphoribosyltransferase [Syntrophothermus sp.]|uniref:orotate phosphoribosyltransferase n=1 Tax=Syntrophothermus sp. TaxID=2736299 RepID=UPI002579ECBF|nr:orotate phosphoribosyltransferase [Syntrophothermus sp.]NSW82257.1 orotate phosphoribosyltransferase [Syntrophothermus sp.]
MSKERAEQIFATTGALLEGHFLLSSGRHSKRYIQCASVLQYPCYTEELAEELASRFRNDNVEVVIGPAMGGIIVAYEVARKLGVKGMFCERENGKMKLRRGFTVVPGQRVLVVEDVITTGGSVREVIQVIREEGGAVIGVAALVDRSGGKVDFGVRTESVLVVDIETFEPDNCPLCKAGKIPLVKPGSRY